MFGPVTKLEKRGPGRYTETALPHEEDLEGVANTPFHWPQFLAVLV